MIAALLQHHCVTASVLSADWAGTFDSAAVPRSGKTLPGASGKAGGLRGHAVLPHNPCNVMNDYSACVD